MTQGQQPEALRLALSIDLMDTFTNYQQEELEAQLEAIGAGGVEPLRRRECLHQIEEPAPAGEYPPLPEPRHRGPAATGSYFDAFTADQMRAYVDADRAMRAQAAPTPSEWDVRGRLAASLTCWHRLTGQEAAELVALFQGHPAQAAPADVAEQGPVAHDEELLEQMYWEFDGQRRRTGEERLAFKGKMRSYASEFRRRSDGKMTFAQSVSDDMMNLADRLGSEYDDVDPRAWKHLLVYAPKAAPAAVAGPSLYQVMAVAKAIHATTPDADDWDSLRQWEVDALRRRAEKVLVALAAPTTQAAPQQESQEPFGWVKSSEIESARRLGGSINLWRLRYDCDTPLYTAPQAAPAAQGDAEDAARWRETLMHIGAANHLGGQHFTLNTLRITDQMFLLRGSVAQHFAKCIDASRAARSKAKEGGAT